MLGRVLPVRVSTRSYERQRWLRPVGALQINTSYDGIPSSAWALAISISVIEIELRRFAVEYTVLGSSFAGTSFDKVFTNDRDGLRTVGALQITSLADGILPKCGPLAMSGSSRLPRPFWLSNIQLGSSFAGNSSRFFFYDRDGLRAVGALQITG
jgi:hypothetical protein